jgi:hypothetical protein
MEAKSHQASRTRAPPAQCLQRRRETFARETASAFYRGLQSDFFGRFSLFHAIFNTDFSGRRWVSSFNSRKITAIDWQTYRKAQESSNQIDLVSKTMPKHPLEFALLIDIQLIPLVERRAMKALEGIFTPKLLGDYCQR